MSYHQRRGRKKPKGAKGPPSFVTAQNNPITSTPPPPPPPSPSPPPPPTPFALFPDAGQLGGNNNGNGNSQGNTQANSNGNGNSQGNNNPPPPANSPVFQPQDTPPPAAAPAPSPPPPGVTNAATTLSQPASSSPSTPQDTTANTAPGQGPSTPSPGLSSPPPLANPTGTTAVVPGASPPLNPSADPSGSSADPSATFIASGANTSTHRKLSPTGAFFVTLLVLLTLIGAIVFVIRRRAKNKRDERQTRWFGSAVNTRITSGGGDTHGSHGSNANNNDNNNMGFLAFGAGDNDASSLGSGTRSVRSSFGTSVDHGLTVPSSNLHAFDLSSFEFPAPEFPPMAEVRQGSITHSDVPVGMFASLGSPSNRTSLQSLHSHNTAARELQEQQQKASSLEGSQGSNGKKQPRLRVNTDIGASMFVSPFGPSEMYAFPTPPLKSSSASLIGGRRSNSLTPPLVPPPPAVLVGDQHPAPLTASVAAPAVNPFEPETIPNPFADPATTGSSSAQGKPLPPVAGVAVNEGEVVASTRRFTATLPDEMNVEPGEKLKIEKMYDDGWLAVKKEEGGGEIGLVPIECFQPVGEDGEEGGDSQWVVVGKKRVSSFFCATASVITA